MNKKVRPSSPCDPIHYTEILGVEAATEAGIRSLGEGEEDSTNMGGRICEGTSMLVLGVAQRPAYNA